LALGTLYDSKHLGQAAPLAADWHAKHWSTDARFGALEALSMRAFMQVVSEQSASRHLLQSSPDVAAHVTHAAWPAAVGRLAQVVHLKGASSVLAFLMQSKQMGGFFEARQAAQVLLEKKGGHLGLRATCVMMPDTQPSAASA
jgi:hypothetical protein